MSHDAIENMSSEQPTPTISRVGSGLSFEDIPSPMGVPPTGGAKEHPDLFMRDDMVTIQVDEILFRIPSYFLTQDSAHFANFLAEKDLKKVITITDSDVSSSAFANLLVVLRPRLGVTPISTLTEWTDVLHLSTKWGFEHLRTAAITAILPLASAVDKLVLGRTYGFVEWVPGAYMDLLRRTEDLTVAEARRMDVEDIVAVAKGRREARTQNVRPDKDIDEVVKRLILVPAPTLPASTSSPVNAPEAVSPLSTEAIPSRQPGIDQVSANLDDRAKISRWVGQMSCFLSQGAPQVCLVKFMQEDRARVPLVLDMVLASGLASVTRALERGGKLMVPHPSCSSYPPIWDGTVDGGCCLSLYNMHPKDTTLGLINSAQIEKACLRLADHWRALKEMASFDVSVNDWLATPTGKSINNTLTYLTYLHDGPNSDRRQSFSVIRPSVFSAFWVEFTFVFKSTPPSRQLALARCTNALMRKHGAGVSKLAVSTEMDEFYLVVEEMRDAAKISGDRPLVALLEDIITARNWPSA